MKTVIRILIVLLTLGALASISVAAPNAGQTRGGGEPGI